MGTGLGLRAEIVSTGEDVRQTRTELELARSRGIYGGCQTSQLGGFCGAEPAKMFLHFLIMKAIQITYPTCENHGVK